MQPLSKFTSCLNQRTSCTFLRLTRTVTTPIPLVQTRIRQMATSRPTSEQLKTLRNYTACDIADALVKLNVPNAGFLADLKLITPSPSRLSSEVTIAPASTVLFKPKLGTPDGFPAANIPSDQHYVDRTQPETIVVIQQPEGQICAVLGGIMALRMKVLNAKGVVVSGRVRDVVELESTGLPIWAEATSIVGTALEAKPHAVQVPLVIGGTKVTPGDLVFSDTTNGVVVIPHDRIAEVISLLPGLVEADDRVKEDVSIGMTVQEAFKTHRG